MLSIIIPANDEADRIGPCLEAVLASDGPERAEAIVVANACRDATVPEAEAFAAEFMKKGWRFEVLDLAEGGKPNALNAGEAVCQFAGARIYLDADVTVSRGLLAAMAAALDGDEPRLAAGTLTVTARSLVSRSYGRIYARVPFIAEGVPAAGCFGLSPAGRARWGAWPDIIGDDAFARHQFAATERIRLAEPYDFPLVEGWSNLVKVRRRQNAGVAELAERFPELRKNFDPRGTSLAHKLTLLATDPIGFAIYTGVALATKLPGETGWVRGR